MPKEKAYIGIKGVLATTHCYVTGISLKNAPMNYNLGDNYYVSVNHGSCLSKEELDIIREHLGLLEIMKEEVIEYDN